MNLYYSDLKRTKDPDRVDPDTENEG